MLYLWIPQWRHGPLIPHTVADTQWHITVHYKKKKAFTIKSVSPSSYYVVVGGMANCCFEMSGNRSLGCPRTPPPQNALKSFRGDTVFCIFRVDQGRMVSAYNISPQLGGLHIYLRKDSLSLCSFSIPLSHHDICSTCSMTHTVRHVFHSYIRPFLYSFCSYNIWQVLFYWLSSPGTWSCVWFTSTDNVYTVNVCGTDSLCLYNRGQKHLWLPLEIFWIHLPSHLTAFTSEVHAFLLH